MLWLMSDDSDDMCVDCSCREDQKNQNIPVAYGSFSRDQCAIHYEPLFPRNNPHFDSLVEVLNYS